MTESELLGLEKGTARLGVDELCRLIGELGSELSAVVDFPRRDRSDAVELRVGPAPKEQQSGRKATSE